MATLIENVQAVANEAGYTVASTVIGSTDTTTKQILAIANRVNKEMANQYAWPQLDGSGSITLVASQASYALPGDFSSYHYETFWNQSTRYRVLGPMSPQEYADIRGFGLTPTTYQNFQLRGISNSQLLINPTPGATTAGEIIIFEYVADRSVRPRTWVTTTVFAAGSYCFNNGNYYKTVLGGTSGATAPTHTSGTVTDGAVLWAYYSGAYNTFLADTDLSVLNSETLQLGMLERFAEIHGLTTILPRYDLQVNQDYSRQSPGKRLYAGGSNDQRISAFNGAVTFSGI